MGNKAGNEQGPQAAPAPAPAPVPKPAPKPAPPPAPPAVQRPAPAPAPAPARPSPPARFIHYNPGPIYAASQREAYELDAEDGVIDGKHFGSDIHVYQRTPPTAESYYSHATNQNPSVRRPHNEWKASAESERAGYGGSQPTAAAAYARSAQGDFPHPPDFHDDGHLSPYGAAHSASRLIPPGRVIGVEYRELPGLGALSAPVRSIPAPVTTSAVASPGALQNYPTYGVSLEHPPHPGASYEYTASSYVNPAYMSGFVGTSTIPADAAYKPSDLALLPPPPPASSKPNIPIKSYYDTYSRFAKVEFHTISKSPYAHLLANQGRTVNIGQVIPQREPEEELEEQQPVEEEPHHIEPHHIEEPVHQQQQAEAPWSRAAPVVHYEPPEPEPPFTIEDPVKPSAYIADYDSPPTPRVNVSPPSPPPAPPAWDNNDPATLGGFDADTSARMAFRRYDTDGNGFLDIYEFMAAMKALGSGTTFKEAQDLFSQIDVDGGGAIEEDEFVRWYVENFSQIRESTDPKKLAQAIFRKYDNDGNGCLDVDEFVGAMRELGLGYSREDAQYVFDTFDNDGGGTIDEKEFVEQYYEQWLQQQ